LKGDDGKGRCRGGGAYHLIDKHLELSETCLNVTDMLFILFLRLGESPELVKQTNDDGLFCTIESFVCIRNVVYLGLVQAQLRPATTANHAYLQMLCTRIQIVTAGCQVAADLWTKPQTAPL